MRNPTRARLASLAQSIVLALGLSSCATSEAPARYHDVKAGETIEEIAALYGIDPWDLARANRVELTERVGAGTKLFLPHDISKLRGYYSNRMDVPLPSAFAFQWPLAAPSVNEMFGWRGGRMHEGLDLKASTGTPVFAASDGKIVFSGVKWKAYGKMVIIEHPEGWNSIYAHLSSLSVGEGERVSRGALVGHSGRTGRATGPHLHFELRKGADPVDPLLFLPPLSTRQSTASTRRRPSGK